MGRVWVVLLECGIDIYQSEDDPTLDEPNSWMRLKQFCEDQKTRPMNMARAGKDLDPQKQINMDPLADGYYYARRVRRLMSGSRSYGGYQDNAEGIGQLHKNTLKIIWELDNGRFDVEERKLDDHPKSKLISLIRK